MNCNSIDINREIKYIIKSTMSNYNVCIQNNERLFSDCYIVIMANILYSHKTIRNLNGYVKAITIKIIENYNNDFKKGNYIEKNELKHSLCDAIQEDILKC